MPSACLLFSQIRARRHERIDIGSNHTNDLLSTHLLPNLENEFPVSSQPMERKPPRARHFTTNSVDLSSDGLSILILGPTMSDGYSSHLFFRRQLDSSFSGVMRHQRSSLLARSPPQFPRQPLLSLSALPPGSPSSFTISSSPVLCSSSPFLCLGCHVNKGYTY